MKNKGFTLIELLIVVVILGIIVSIAISAIYGKVKNDFGNPETAQVEYQLPADKPVAPECIRGFWTMKTADGEWLMLDPTTGKPVPCKAN